MLLRLPLGFGENSEPLNSLHLICLICTTSRPRESNYSDTRYPVSSKASHNHDTRILPRLLDVLVLLSLMPPKIECKPPYVSPQW